jgi:hypothetical protein
VKPESEGSVEEPDKEEGSAHREPRTCPTCGTKFVASDSEFCPVCILRGAFGAESADTGESGSLGSLPFLRSSISLTPTQIQLSWPQFYK